MIDTIKLSRITSMWSSEVGKYIKDNPTDIRFVTGDYHIDRQIYYFEQESGILLHLTADGKPYMIKGYDIIDEQKYICFLLRYN